MAQELDTKLHRDEDGNMDGEITTPQNLKVELVPKRAHVGDGKWQTQEVSVHYRLDI